MPIIYLSVFTLVLLGAMFLLHRLRLGGFPEPFAAFICLLWYLSFLSGGLNYAIEADVFGNMFRLRYTTAIYVLVFAGIMLVYITEGVPQARNLIFLSIGCQIFLIFFSTFLHTFAEPLLKDNLYQAARSLLEPNMWRLMTGVGIAAVDLFLTVMLFQFIINRLPSLPVWIGIAFALWLTMAFDSLVFVALTRIGEFSRNFQSHLFFKTIMTAIFTIPLGMYVSIFKKKFGLDLKRGSLDIFRRIEALQEDLKVANEKLREYAHGLEKMVEERTAEIREKQAILQKEIEMAVEVQQALLPHANAIEPVVVSQLFIPCHEVSGDLYDYAKLRNGEYYFFVADITGHGVPSALVGAMCKMSLSGMDFVKSSTAQILSVISDSIRQVTSTHYLTGILIRINPGQRTLTYASGGHVPAIIISTKGAVTQLEPTGPLMGAFAGGNFEERTIPYATGSRLIIYSDGITEERNHAKEEFGDNQFMKILKSNITTPSQELTKIVIDALREFSQAEKFSDDVTLVIADLL